MKINGPPEIYIEQFGVLYKVEGPKYTFITNSNESANPFGLI